MRQLSLTLMIALVLLLVSPTASVWAANATFLKDTALAFLSDEDRKMQLDAALLLLESPDSQMSKEWKNPASGSLGRVESLGNFKSEGGLHCRKMKLFTQAKGIESQFAFPVCKGLNGEWFIASGMRLSKA